MPRDLEDPGGPPLTRGAEVYSEVAWFAQDDLPPMSDEHLGRVQVASVHEGPTRLV